MHRFRRRPPVRESSTLRRLPHTLDDTKVSGEPGGHGRTMMSRSRRHRRQQRLSRRSSLAEWKSRNPKREKQLYDDDRAELYIVALFCVCVCVVAALPDSPWRRPRIIIHFPKR